MTRSQQAVIPMIAPVPTGHPHAPHMVTAVAISVPVVVVRRVPTVVKPRAPCRPIVHVHLDIRRHVPLVVVEHVPNLVVAPPLVNTGHAPRHPIVRLYRDKPHRVTALVVACTHRTVVIQFRAPLTWNARPWDIPHVPMVVVPVPVMVAQPVAVPPQSVLMMVCV